MIMGRLLNRFDTLLRAWRKLLLGAIAGATVGVAVSFLVPRQYTATASFIPESTDSGNLLRGLAGVAAQLNLGGSMTPGQSPQFFADVLTSREIIDAVLAQPISGNDSTVLDLFVGPDDSVISRVEEGRRELRRHVSASANPRTSIVSINVLGPTPALATAIASSFLRVLDQFNRKTRQSQAGARRQFAEARGREANDSLASAERQLRLFVERNRMYNDSPSLLLEYERLQRQVARTQDLATNLGREYEMARIAEANDTPVLSILDRPYADAKASAPRRLLWMIAGSFAGLMLAIGSALRAGTYLRQWFRPSSQTSSE